MPKPLQRVVQPVLDQDRHNSPAPSDDGESPMPTPFLGGDPHWPHDQAYDDERGGGGDWARSTRGNSYRPD